MLCWNSTFTYHSLVQLCGGLAVSLVEGWLQVIEVLFIFIHDAYLSSPSGEKGVPMAEAQFQLNSLMKTPRLGHYGHTEVRAP